MFWIIILKIVSIIYLVTLVGVTTLLVLNLINPFHKLFTKHDEFWDKVIRILANGLLISALLLGGFGSLIGVLI